MSRLPSWPPVLAATAGSIAAAWYLPQWGAIAAVAVLFGGAVAWPAIRERRRQPRCKVCEGPCLRALEDDGEPLDGGEVRRWLGITGLHDCGVLAPEPVYGQRQEGGQP